MQNWGVRSLAGDMRRKRKGLDHADRACLARLCSISGSLLIQHAGIRYNTAQTAAYPISLRATVVYPGFYPPVEPRGLSDACRSTKKESPNS